MIGRMVFFTDKGTRMEFLTKKPFFLTDEDILWVGNTLADMLPTECFDAAQVKQLHAEGRASLVAYKPQDENFRACVDAGVLYVRAASADILVENFNGIVITFAQEQKLRDEFINFLAVQATLGLHK